MNLHLMLDVLTLELAKLRRLPMSASITAAYRGMQMVRDDVIADLMVAEQMRLRGVL